jgi:hypothetical protein
VRLHLLISPGIDAACREPATAGVSDGLCPRRLEAGSLRHAAGDHTLTLGGYRNGLYQFVASY